MEYYSDDRRHLVCEPYSTENLHIMAADLGIKKCWFHRKPYDHYDIPKKRFTEIVAKTNFVNRRVIVEIIHGRVV